MINENRNLKQIDSNDQGETLYRLTIEDWGVDTVMFMNAEGGEYCLSDWQRPDQPETIDEMQDYDWYPLADIFDWHD